MGFSATLVTAFTEPLQKRKRTKKDPGSSSSGSSSSSSSSSTVKIEELATQSKYETLKGQYDALREKHASLEARAKDADIEISDSD